MRQIQKGAMFPAPRAKPGALVPVTGSSAPSRRNPARVGAKGASSHADQRKPDGYKVLDTQIAILV